MTLLRRSQRPSPASYGTADFTARLAAREAALGLADTADRAPDAPAVSDVPMVPADEMPARDEAQHDDWGNVRTSPLGWYGQYTFTSQWGDGRTVYVCGDIDKAWGTWTHWHMWKRDRREHGQGFICPACFPIEAGMFGSVERGR